MAINGGKVIVGGRRGLALCNTQTLFYDKRAGYYVDIIPTLRTKSTEILDNAKTVPEGLAWITKDS